jgi:diaminopimelate epimerase
VGARRWEDDTVTTLALAKYHGLGNDFLILVDWEATAPYDEALVSALCDRHRGIGADGVLRLSRPVAGGDVRMELRNADGGEAATSGNGLRCAVLASAHAGLVPKERLEGSVTIETKGGLAFGRLLSGSSPGPVGEVAISMGVAAISSADGLVPFSGWRALRVDVGNPHLVLLGEAGASLDLAEVGPDLEASVAGGTNVEAVVVRDGHLELVVWERGVGLTLACGSGSCAAAAAARSLGLVSDRVVVSNPGGQLVVELDGPATEPRVVLSGPACRVGEIVVDPAELAVAVGAPR